jgi:hypothetical protein
MIDAARADNARLRKAGSTKCEGALLLFSIFFDPAPAVVLRGSA